MSDSMAYRMDSPVGTALERADRKLWPGGWFDATGFNVLYGATGSLCYHTGADLNLNSPAWDADRDAPVFAIGNGQVDFAGLLPVWGQVIVVRHALPNHSPVWSRYAHLGDIAVVQGASVSRGDLLGHIGNAEGRYPYHLHFDTAWIDLGQRPGDWPGLDQARLARDYCDPLALIASYHYAE